MILLAVGLARAGAWTRAPGDVWLKLGADVFVATKYVDPLTGTDSSTNYFGQQYSVQAESGILPHLQLSASLPLTIGRLTFADARVGTVGTGTATSARLGDARVAVQVGILKSVAVAVEGKIPMYDNSQVGAQFGAYSAVFPRAGDGQVDLTGWALAGASVLHGGWVEAAAGYRHRTEWWVGAGPDVVVVDCVPWRVGLGHGLGKGWAALSGDGNISVRADLYSRAAATLALAGGMGLPSGFGVSGRVGYDVWTKNTAPGLGAGLGVTWQRPAKSD